MHQFVYIYQFNYSWMIYANKKISKNGHELSSNFAHNACFESVLHLPRSHIFHRWIHWGNHTWSRAYLRPTARMSRHSRTERPHKGPCSHSSVRQTRPRIRNYSSRPPRCMSRRSGRDSLRYTLARPPSSSCPGNLGAERVQKWIAQLSWIWMIFFFFFIWLLWKYWPQWPSQKSVWLWTFLMPLFLCCIKRMCPQKKMALPSKLCHLRLVQYMNPLPIRNEPK